MKKGTGWKLGTIALAGTMTVVTATLAGVGGVALNIAQDVLPVKPKNLALEEKINYVALGDGLTSGSNMLIGDDYASFTDFFAADLQKANKLGSYKNFADSSFKIFDVLNNALMGPAREAIKEADLITITAGTNDLLGLMELFGVPIASLSVNEEADRFDLDKQTEYSKRQDNVVNLLESLGNAMKTGDFSGAISIDENVYKDLFLAVNLNLTLLTTEIAKIAPEAKIILVSPFNPLDGLPTPLTESALGNDSEMTFGKLFDKLIDTYDTVEKLNPAVTHVNMGDIEEFKNDKSTTEVAWIKPGSPTTASVTKDKKRFNGLDMNPSTYGQQLIGNGLFKIFESEFGISGDYETLSVVADQDGVAEMYDDAGNFAPEQFDETNNSLEIQNKKALIMVGEQVLEYLNTMSGGPRESDNYVVTDSSSVAKFDLVPQNKPYGFSADDSLYNLLQFAVTNNTPTAKLMAGLHMAMAANTQDEINRLTTALKGQLRLSSLEQAQAKSLLGDQVGKTLAGADTTITPTTDVTGSLILEDGTTQQFNFPKGIPVNLSETFGVKNIAQLYGKMGVSRTSNIINTSWDEFFSWNYSWYRTAVTAFTPTKSIFSVQTMPSLFAYTSPMFQIVEDGLDDFMDTVREMSIAELIDIDKLEAEFKDAMSKPNPRTGWDVNPPFSQIIYQDIFGVSTLTEFRHLLDPTDSWSSRDFAHYEPAADAKVAEYLANDGKYSEIVKFVNLLAKTSSTIHEVAFS